MDSVSPGGAGGAGGGAWTSLTPTPQSPRAQLLDEAKHIVTGDRNNTYGPPHQDFQRTADAMNAYGYAGPGGKPLTAHDTALILMLVKISRLMWSPEKYDSWLDVAGYAACGHECVIEEGKCAHT